MDTVLQQIASRASSLSHSELRVLLELAVRAIAASPGQVKASSRDLARTTGLARASVQTALASLNGQGLVHSTDGGSNESAFHHVTYLSQGGPTVEPGVAQKLGQGGLMAEPGVDQKLDQGGPTIEPGVAQILGQGGLIVGPLLNEKSSTYQLRPKENASVRSESIDSDIDKTIDRLQKAKKADFDESLFEHARQQIASHHAKFAREQNRQSGLPDDSITAQFLAVAEWPRLEAILYDLIAERKEAGHSYAWYVTVALQRIHGISPHRLRDLRSIRPKSSVREHGGRELESQIPHKDQELSTSSSPDRKTVKPFRPHPDVELVKQQLRAMASARSF